MNSLGAKAVFFDIDGTLYDRDRSGEVPETTRTALKRLRERGHRTFICTGRVLCAVEPPLRRLGFDGMILGCGTHILYRGSQLFYHTMEEETARRLAELVRNAGGIAVLEGRDGLYCDRPPEGSEFYPYYRKRLERLGGTLLPASGRRREISKMTVRFSAHDPLRAQRLKEASAWADVLDAGTSVEFVPKGFSKASGIAYILEKLGINREDTYAFGDSVNDHQMLSFVGCGIAMGNSSPETLRLCRVRTEPVYEDGIYKACVRLGLI